MGGEFGGGGPHLGADTPRGSRVRGFSTGLDTPHNITTPRNYHKGGGGGGPGKGAFFGGRSLPEQVRSENSFPHYHRPPPQF